jgi:hypothetical protein
MNEFELQLQRLVDGQLNREQVQQLLSQADQNNLWREIAAAFVEDQLWRAEIVSEMEHVASAPPVKEKPSPSDSQSSVGIPGAKFWLALAAAVLAGIWLGQAWAPSDTRSDATNELADIQPDVASPDEGAVQVPPTQLVENLQPAHRLSMGDAGEVPLYTIEQAQKIGLLNEPAVPQETIDQFRQQGYQLQQNTRYISGRAQDGRQIVVPIRSVRLDPGN